MAGTGQIDLDANLWSDVQSKTNCTTGRLRESIMRSSIVARRGLRHLGFALRLRAGIGFGLLPLRRSRRTDQALHALRDGFRRTELGHVYHPLQRRR